MQGSTPHRPGSSRQKDGAAESDLVKIGFVGSDKAGNRSALHARSYYQFAEQQRNRPISFFLLHTCALRRACMLVYIRCISTLRINRCLERHRQVEKTKEFGPNTTLIIFFFTKTNAPPFLRRLLRVQAIECRKSHRVGHRNTSSLVKCLKAR